METTSPFARRLRTALLALGVALCMAVAYGVGRVQQSLIEAHYRQDEQIQRIERLILSDPDRFVDLRFNRGPLDKFRVEGTVASSEDLDFLTTHLIRLLGEYKALFVNEVKVVQPQPEDDERVAPVLPSATQTLAN